MVAYWNNSTQNYCTQLFNVISLIPVSTNTSKKTSARVEFLASTILNYARESSELADEILTRTSYMKVQDSDTGLVQLTKDLNNLMEDVAPTFKDAAYILNYVTVAPIILNTLAAVFCMGCSAIFHLGNVHSATVSAMLARLDYGGISVLIFGSSIPIITYAFACDEVLSKFQTY